MELCIIPAPLNQFLVGAFLCNGSVSENDDLVGKLNGRHSVADEDRGSILHHFPQGIQDALFGHRVHTGQGIVQNQDFRITDQRSGNCGPLLLPAGKRDPPLPNNCFQLPRKPLHVGKKMGQPGRFTDFILCRLRRPESNVAGNRIGEQEGFLRHIANT